MEFHPAITGTLATTCFKKYKIISFSVLNFIYLILGVGKFNFLKYSSVEIYFPKLLFKYSEPLSPKSLVPKIITLHSGEHTDIVTTGYLASDGSGNSSDTTSISQVYNRGATLPSNLFLFSSDRFSSKYVLISNLSGDSTHCSSHCLPSQAERCCGDDVFAI